MFRVMTLILLCAGIALSASTAEAETYSCGSAGGLHVIVVPAKSEADLRRQAERYGSLSRVTATRLRYLICSRAMPAWSCVPVWVSTLRPR
jgi:hypothetical protein